VDANSFRGFVKAPNRCPLGDLPTARLYTPAMDALFQRHYSVLEAVFRRLKTKPYLTPSINSRLELPQWLEFLKELRLMHPRMLDRQAATLCFLRSRMTVVHALEHYAKFKSLSFTDFLEAIARVADWLRPVPLDELKRRGVDASRYILELTDPYNLGPLGASNRPPLPAHACSRWGCSASRSR
jgi:hypothetical protein